MPYTNREDVLDDLAADLSRYRASNLSVLKALSISEQRALLSERARKWLSLEPETAALVSVDDEGVQNIVFDNTVSKIVKAPNIVYAATWKPWLENRRNTIDWSYSKRYFDYLAFDKHWANDSIESIKKASDEILDHCGDPFSRDNVFVKGLVVGDIQSGKTASYTALINKAIDAGFKVVIVFTGTTKELRAQTQKRLDYEVMGLTRPNANRPFEKVGVGKYDVEAKVDCLTNANIDGELKTPRGTYTISDNSLAYLAVIKKTPKVLEAVIKFIQSSVTCMNDPDNKLPYPVLIIDDEADLASINTKGTERLNEASGTNKLIRTILCKACRNVTYVGYTATPFANVFVKPYSEVSAEDADDIFPDDFIVTLPTPPGYSGVKDFFGITKDTQFDDSCLRKDLLAEISESDRAGFKKYQAAGVASRDQVNLFFPDSLRKAMMCFLIGVGVKISRGIRENCTMLVNVDVRTIYNQSLRENVRDNFESICNQFLTLPEAREDFKNYWENKMRNVSLIRFKEQGKELKDTWEGIERGIEEAISWKTYDSVKLITSAKGSDLLDYSATNHGLYVVVGGPKLSRGLTLEGLSVSYYGRNTHAFDTLLQMGRWFGYRRGWIDICRVFTTKRIANNFIEAAISLESFKDQVDKMKKQQSTPRDFGLQVLTYTSMMPTSPVKMRDAVKQKISFSGSLTQVLDYKYSDKVHNSDLVEKFLQENGPAFQKRSGPNYVIENVDVAKILRFLRSYKSPSATVGLWINYIEKLSSASGELHNWTVVLSSKIIKGESDIYLDDGFGDRCYIKKASRAVRLDGRTDNGFSLRVLTRPTDFLDFFSEEDLKNLPKNLDSYVFDDPFVIQRFTSDCALLGIYFFDPKERDEDGGAIIERGSSSVGLGIWFPVSKGSDTEYRYINEVLRKSLNMSDDASNTKPEEEENGD